MTRRIMPIYDHGHERRINDQRGIAERVCKTLEMRQIQQGGWKRRNLRPGWSNPRQIQIFLREQKESQRYQELPQNCYWIF